MVKKCEFINDNTRKPPNIHTIQIKMSKYFTFYAELHSYCVVMPENGPLVYYLSVKKSC